MSPSYYCRYYTWIFDIQTILNHWHNKIFDSEVSYDQICLYKCNQAGITSMEIATRNSTLYVGVEHVESVFIGFCEQLDKLNSLLLWYITTKWCSLPSILEEYGVNIPPKIKTFIKNISFPDQNGHHSMKDLGTNIIPHYRKGVFKPDWDISVRLHREVTLNELVTIVQEIDDFLIPLKPHYQVLVFFKSEGILFNKYMKNSQKSSSLDAFLNAIEHSSKLINRVMSGTATYSEITAGDQQFLKYLDIEREFALLCKYASLCGSTSDESGVQSMLELPQYKIHTENIKKACKQYHLDVCLKDQNFINLLKIMKDNSSIEVRSKMTPNKAKSIMNRVKTTLCLTEKTHTKCLKIFEVVMNSIEFYRFINEKKFHGEGQASFFQQYELITAQLQHEDYEEDVLNQLKPAFKVLTIFMDQDQSFAQLMKQVTNLPNPVDNLKHLETINGNVMTIQKWFSRAEVRISYDPN